MIQDSSPAGTATDPTVRVDADKDACVGAGNCLIAAPQVFGLDDDGAVEVLHPELSDAQTIAKARAAASTCPAMAIEVTS